VVAVVGKSWDLHVKLVLRTSLAENLEMISDTIRLLKAKGREAILDSEHFFDGFARNPEYALATLAAAAEAGADWIVLCDTNGGTTPEVIQAAVEQARRHVATPLGIHAHNDGELAVANSLAAVAGGAKMVQGTVNGYGERCGNANLCSIIPNLQLKQDRRCLPPRALAGLYGLAHYVAEMANMPPDERQPFVGRSAFTHKGGLHQDAVLKSPETYEHISPETVGNQRRMVVSDQSGASAVVHQARAKGLGMDLTKDSPEAREILGLLKHMEHEGYQFEGADASFELLMRRSMGKDQKLFELQGFRVVIEKWGEEGEALSEATIRLVVDGQRRHVAAEGDGPVNALDNALRKALEEFYPELGAIRLSDFKVRVIDTAAGTAAKTRVLMESHDEEDSWGTVGVHENIVQASWEALVDSLAYGLLKSRSRRSRRPR
jgi:2-isopropylmalate synthase